MAGNSGCKNINTWGLVLSFSLIGLVLVWFVFQVYVRVYLNEDLVFPMDTKNADLIEIEPGRIVSQEFVTLEENLVQIKLMMYEGNNHDFVFQVDTGGDPIVAELPYESYVESPDVSIVLPEPIAKGELVELSLQNTGEATGSYQMWMQTQRANYGVGVDQAAKIDGVAVPRSLLYRPVFENKDRLVVGDYARAGVVLRELMYRLVEGKPVFVQWMLVITLFTSLVLSGWFVYVLFDTATKDVGSKDKRSIAIAILVIVMAVIIFV